jgi:hypothetical protein
MPTLTIELPDELAQQIQGRGISQAWLEKVVAHFVLALLQEWEEESLASPSEAPPTHPTRNDGAAFARQIVANNRELFEELAQL